MRRLFSLFLLMIIVGSNVFAAEVKNEDCVATFSKKSGILALEIGARDQVSSVYSKDKKASIRISKDGMFFVGKRKTIELKDIEYYSAMNEVLWSDDSKRFAITSSDGGMEGTWHVYVFEIDELSGLKQIKFPTKMNQVLKKLPNCESGYPANVGAVKWTNEGRNLVIAAQVSLNGTCKNPGHTVGMEVSFDTPALTKKFSKRELLKRFPESVGCFLREE